MTLCNKQTAAAALQYRVGNIGVDPSQAV